MNPFTTRSTACWWTEWVSRQRTNFTPKWTTNWNRDKFAKDNSQRCLEWPAMAWMWSPRTHSCLWSWVSETGSVSPEWEPTPTGRGLNSTEWKVCKRSSSGQLESISTAMSPQTPKANELVTLISSKYYSNQLFSLFLSLLLAKPKFEGRKFWIEIFPCLRAWIDCLFHFYLTPIGRYSIYFYDSMISLDSFVSSDAGFSFFFSQIIHKTPDLNNINVAVISIKTIITLKKFL